MSKKNAASNPCICSETTFPKVLVATPGCSNDDAEVAALPEELEERHSGPILANYLNERRRNHENLLGELADGTTFINLNVDAKIQELAEQLLYYIKRNEKDMECVIERCDSGKNTLDVQFRKYVLQQINDLYNKRLEDMADFRKNALKLEKERADGLKNVLQQQFQRFVAVGHKSPKELLHDFDERIYGINQQLLSNIRAYGDLDSHLRTQADKNMVKLKSRLNQLCLGIGRAYRTRSAQRHSPIVSVDGRAYLRRSTSASGRKRSSSLSLGDSSVDLILGNVKEIEDCVEELVEAYRHAVLNVFNGFTGKFIDLHETLANNSVDGTGWKSEWGTQVQDMIEHALQGLSKCFHKKISSSTIELSDLIPIDILNMQKSLWSLGDRLRETYVLLNDAGNLCNAHMMRSAHAQKLTMAAVEDLLSSNDTNEQANEISFNLGLVQLCTSPDTEILKQHYEVLIATLNNIDGMYQQHRIAEIGRLEEFMNLSPIMANILLSEFAYFLEQHPRSKVQVSELNIGSVSPSSTPRRDNSKSIKSPIPRAILQTELQEAALTNWRNGFLETFESNICLVPDELLQQARQWVNERTAILQLRFSVKSSSHSIRKERVEAAYNKRLDELHYHESRLRSHLEAIYSLVEKLPDEVSAFLKMEAPVLYPLNQWVDRIDADMTAILGNPDVDPEVLNLKMKSYLPRLTKYRQLFETSLDEAISLYKNHVEHKIQEARVSNIRFIRQIKLFGEGGNYSTTESLKTSATLVKGSETLETCESHAMEALSNRRAQLFAIADQSILPLQKVIGDVLRIGGKQTAVRKPVKKK